MSLTKRAVAAGAVGATPTSTRSMSLSQKKRAGSGEHHSRGAETKVSYGRWTTRERWAGCLTYGRNSIGFINL